MPQSKTQDACDLLDADHIAVKHLFVDYARLAVTGGERQPIAQRICDELTVHAQIEEEIFYPALRKAIGEAELLEHAKDEHQEAKNLVAQIEGLGAAGPEMDALVTKLAQVVEHHVKEERDKLFTKARSQPKLDLVEVGQQLKARQTELMGQMA